MEYAIVTFLHDSFGSVDIKISRKLPAKKCIINLLDALKIDMASLDLVFCLKAKSSGAFLNQNETLEQYDIYDGETLEVL